MLTTNHLHQITGTLTPRAPFDFAKTLAFLGDFTPTAGEQALAPDSITKAVTLHGRAIAFSVRNTGTLEEPRVAYTLYAEHPLSEPELGAVIDRIRFFLSLDDDLQPFYAIGRTDPAFAPVMEHLYGLHQPKFLTPFEIACWAILAQRNPLAMAHRTKMALVQRWGTSITSAGRNAMGFSRGGATGGSTSRRTGRSCTQSAQSGVSEFRHRIFYQRRRTISAHR